MASSVMTGFCRLTIVAPNIRVDVALPEDVPLAELMPDVLRLTDQWQSEQAHAGFTLTRLGTGPLDTGLALAAQGVRNGDLLYLRPVAETLPPLVYDDVVDAIASKITDDGYLWGGQAVRAAGLTAGALMLGLGVLALWYAGSPHGVPGAVAGVVALLLLMTGAVRSRVYADHVSGALIGAGAIVYGFIAGLGILPLTSGGYLGRTHFIAGCGVALVIAAIGAVLQEEHDEPFVAGGVAALVGVLAGCAAIASKATPVEVAAVTGAVGLAGIGFVPGLALRFSRLPVQVYVDTPQRPGSSSAGLGSSLPEGDDTPVDAEAVAAQARRGNQVLSGLVAGCATVLALSAVVLAWALPPGGGSWARALAALLAFGAFSRARLFSQRAHILPLVVAGVTAVVLTVMGIGLHVTPTSRESWLVIGVLVAALIAFATAFSLPERSLSPSWGRTLDISEGLLLAAVIPVALAVLNVYTRIRNVG
jgi:type VII secretion integral membrane protein EccD